MAIYFTITPPANSVPTARTVYLYTPVVKSRDWQTVDR